MDARSSSVQSVETCFACGASIEEARAFVETQELGCGAWRGIGGGEGEGEGEREGEGEGEGDCV